MPITYDPMNYVGDTGTAISNIGSQIAQTVASIPSLLKADKAYKMAEEAHKTEDNLKAAAYTGTNSLFQKIGLNKSVRAPMKGETKDDYLQYIASEFHPLLSDENGGLDNGKFALIKERLGQIGLGDNKTLNNDMQVNAFLSDSKPIQQNNSGAGVVPQAQVSQPQQTTLVQPENPFADWTDKDFFSGLIKEDTPSQANTQETPIQLPENAETQRSLSPIIDTYTKHMNESIENLNKGVRGGYVSVADAEKQRQGYVDRLADLTMQEMKTRLEERKLLAKEAEKQSMDEATTRQKQDFEKEKLGIEHQNRLGEIAEQNKGRSTNGNYNVSDLTEEERTALDTAIANGLDPYVINSRTAKIYADLELASPGRKWNELGGNAKYGRSQSTMNSITLINSITPLFDNVLDLGKKLENGDVQFLNTAFNELKKQTGNPDIVAFNNARDDMVFEAERALMGSGQLSDSKIKRAWDNVNSSMNMKQLEAAIKNLDFTLKARKEALLKGPYPANDNGGAGTTSPPVPAVNSGSAVPVGQTITHTNGVKITRIE